MIKNFIRAICLLLIFVIPASAQYRVNLLVGGSSTVRALGANHAWISTFENSGGTSFGRMYRLRLSSKIAFTCVQVVYTTFWQAGNTSTGLFDQDIPQPLNIQAAFEAPAYTNSLTGIPARAQFTFSGSPTYVYGGAGSNPTGLAVSDKYCPTGGVAANTYFGIWSSVEPPLTQPLTYAITALSSVGTTATASIANTTGLYLGEIFNVSGASVAGYNNQASAITAIVPNVSVSYTTISSNLAADTTATGAPYLLPANVVASGAVSRFEGSTPATSAVGSFVATNAVATATSITAFNGPATTPTGNSAGFVPAFLLIDGYKANDKLVFNLGDSTEFGVSAGGATNVLSRDGDSEGQPDKAISWMDQGVQLNNNLNFVNGGKGGDGAKWLHVPSAWKYRQNAMVLANPTHIINGMAFNDQGLAAVGGTWSANNSTYYRGIAVLKSGNAYIELNGTPTSTCVSGATGPVGTTIGVYEADGTCLWAYVGAQTTLQPGAQGIGWNMVLNDQLRALLPGAPIYNTTMMPNATLASPFLTLTDQTVTADNLATRNHYNASIKNQQNLLLWAGVFDLNTYVENDPIGGDGKWIVDGVTPNLVTTGAHPNGNGYRLGAQAIPAGSFP